MKNPRVKVISSREMKKRFGFDKGGYSVGKTIYLTSNMKPSERMFVLEHEKAHIKLGHKPANVNKYQFVRKELKADKVATQMTGRKYRKKYLDAVVEDTSIRFGVPRASIKPLVHREAKKLKLIR
jgi:hypothetical protein